MHRPHLLTAVLVAALLLPTLDATAKRKPKKEEVPAVEPATFQVFGYFLQEKSNFDYGDKLECDLTIYVVEGDQPVTDATVTVGDIAVPHDQYFEGRYKVLQNCVDAGTTLPIKIQRGNQLWEQTRTMPGYPELQEPAADARVPADRDLTVRWLAADGARTYRTRLVSGNGEWFSSGPSVSIPKTEIPPFCRHEIELSAIGAAIDRKSETQPLSGAERAWPGVTPITCVHGEFDFGPSLVDVDWAGQAVVEEKLHKVWLHLDPDGGYLILSVKIGTFEQAMLNGEAIEWLDHDGGSYRLGNDGNLLLESVDTEGLTWTASYADPTITLQRVLPPTDDPEEQKKRKYDGPPEPWEMKIEEVEPVMF